MIVPFSRVVTVYQNAVQPAGALRSAGTVAARGGRMRAQGWRSGYALGSVGSSLRLLHFVTALRVIQRSPGREELLWPKASFRPSLTGSSTDGSPGEPSG